jgi:hypothetical protein
MFAEMSPIEAVWLLISVIGLIFGIVNLRSAYSDQAAARLVKNYRHETRLLLAAGAIQRTWVRVGVFAWWTLLGIGFGFFDLPDVPRVGGLLGLIVTAAGLAANGIQEARERGEVAEMLADDIKEDEG